MAADESADPTPGPGTPEATAPSPPSDPVMSFSEFEAAEFHPLDVEEKRSNLTLERPSLPQQPQAPSEPPQESKTT